MKDLPDSIFRSTHFSRGHVHVASSSIGRRKVIFSIPGEHRTAIGGQSETQEIPSSVHLHLPEQSPLKNHLLSLSFPHCLRS